MVSNVWMLVSYISFTLHLLPQLPESGEQKIWIV